MIVKSIRTKLNLNQFRGLKRHRFTIKRRDQHLITLNKQPLINFTHNDYLALSTHPKVREAFSKAAAQYGLGSGASAVVSGYYSPHQALEEQFADFLQRDRAILFSSGYLANLGVFNALANHECTIISDKRCHTSILEGIQLSRARHYRYAHNNIDHARVLLNKAARNTLLITESVFSMEGDISPLDHLTALTQSFGTTLLVDDAHGFGILGQHGRGACEHFQLSQHDVPILIVPLGKAMGSMGAIVAGNETLIEAILQFATSYRYTTALPPAIAAGSLATLNILQQETWRREKLRSLIAFFIRESALRGLSLLSDAITPIKSILIGENHQAEAMQTYLFKQHIFVTCIRPPTVPAGTARLRISLNCMHEEKDIIRLLDAIQLNIS